MTAAADASAERIRDVNTRYHDLAADSYDAKWGIDFAETGRAQVRAKLEKALGGSGGPWERTLEIGAGTGYFSLNLLGSGLTTAQALGFAGYPDLQMQLRAHFATRAPERVASAAFELGDAVPRIHAGRLR